jgi:hypothetical protein
MTPPLIDLLDNSQSKKKSRPKPKYIRKVNKSCQIYLTKDNTLLCDLDIKKERKTETMKSELYKNQLSKTHKELKILRDVIQEKDHIISKSETLQDEINENIKHIADLKDQISR